MTTIKRDLSMPFNRVLYALFLALTLYQVLVLHGFVEAAS
jgi:hypothetical protein